MKFNRIMLFGAFASAFVATAAVAAYSPTLTTQTYVDDLADTKQAKLSGTSGYVVTYGATAGTLGERQVKTSITNAETNDTSLPTSGAVVSALNTKQGIMSAPSNSVVTYTGTTGVVSSRGIYQSSGSYSSQTDTLAEAQHVNAAVANAFNAHITCHRYATPGDTTSDCLLWNVNNLSGTYVPQNQ